MWNVSQAVSVFRDGTVVGHVSSLQAHALVIVVS